MKKYLLYGFILGAVGLATLRNTLESVRDSRYQACDTQLTSSFGHMKLSNLQEYSECQKKAEFSSLEKLLILSWR